MNFLELSNEQRKLVISQASAEEGINANLVEKDWWICQVLKALYTLPCAEYISFKGGTSLSKCWKLIERFSEDVDIAIDREFLGFSGKLSKTQISDKLRRAVCSYVREKLQYELRDVQTASISIICCLQTAFSFDFCCLQTAFLYLCKKYLLLWRTFLQNKTGCLTECRPISFVIRCRKLTGTHG